MIIGSNSTQLTCPRCIAALPAERQEFPWCECGWNLPADPLEDMRGWQRFRARVSRALGRIQDQQDARWIHRNPTGSVFWIALNGLMYSIGILFILGAVALYLSLVVLAIVGIAGIPQNCLLALLPLGISAAFLYYWRPYRTWFPPKAHHVSEIYDNVLETARGVADRLGISPPILMTFSPWPIIQATAAFRVLPFPHFDRHIIIGIPLLSSLSVSDVKVLLGHAMLLSAGAKAILLPSIGKVLTQVWKVFDRISNNLVNLALYVLFTVIPLGLIIYAPWFLLGRVPVASYTVGVIRGSAVVVLSVLVVSTCLVWLAGTWYRRSILLSDRALAKSFGRNTLMQALPRSRLVSRTFARQWAGLSSDARWGKLPDANMFAAFQSAWDSLPPAYKEKSLREVAVDYPSFIYFEPTLGDRAELLKDIPDQLTDNRPAAALLPSIRDIGEELTKSMFG